MNQVGVTTETGDESAAGTARGEAGTGRRYVSKATRYARWAVESGAAAGTSGGVSLVRGIRSLRRGHRVRGSARLLFGGMLLAVAVTQRRSTGSRRGERTDVDRTDTAPGVEADGGGNASDDGGGDEGESYERLGEAAFDGHSGQVPVPQRAFNVKLLALGAEAFWGVREADDAVLVSQLYDPIQERSGIRYVASSQVDDERMLTIPDAVLDHWDEVAGGGTAVPSGTDLVFATSDRFEADSQLVVVPEPWVDDVLGGEEE